jgi:hypothetical protein
MITITKGEGTFFATKEDLLPWRLQIASVPDKRRLSGDLGLWREKLSEEYNLEEKSTGRGDLSPTLTESFQIFPFPSLKTSDLINVRI